MADKVVIGQVVPLVLQFVPALSFKKCSIFVHLPWKRYELNLTVSLNNAVKNWFLLVTSRYCPQHSAVCRSTLAREGCVNRPLAGTSVLFLPLVLLHLIAVLGWRPLPLAPGLTFTQHYILGAGVPRQAAYY